MPSSDPTLILLREEKLNVASESLASVEPELTDASEKFYDGLVPEYLHQFLSHLEPDGEGNGKFSSASDTVPSAYQPQGLGISHDHYSRTFYNLEEALDLMRPIGSLSLPSHTIQGSLHHTVTSGIASPALGYGVWSGNRDDAAPYSGNVPGVPETAEYRIPQSLAPDTKGEEKDLRTDASPSTRNPGTIEHDLSSAESISLENAIADASDTGKLESQISILRMNLNKQLLKQLRCDISKLKFLQYLKLSRNSLNELPDEMTKLTCLKYLYVNNNVLVKLPESFGLLNQLRCLDLRENKLGQLPASFSGLSLLEYLDLSSNELSNLPNGFGADWHFLEHLNLNNNILVEFGCISHTATFSALTILRLSCNQLLEFPPALCERCTLLSELDISRNRISVIPQEISRLQQLQILNLGVNYIEELPQNIGTLTQLDTLSLHQNYLTETPLSFVALTGLRTLYLRKNEFYAIPKTIFQMDSLRKLDLNFMKLAALPPDIGLLSNLEILQLRETMLKALPDEICGLQKLRDLDLSLNNMNKIPVQIMGLPNLRTLEAMYNHLIRLPEDISRLDRLVNLDLSHNKLTNLPESIAKLTALVQLDLSCNKLPHIPESLLQLPKMKFLSFGYNKLKTEEKKALKKRFKD